MNKDSFLFLSGSARAPHSHLIHCCASGETKAKGDRQPQSGITASMLLVTGGAGFIGSNMVANLNEAGRADIAVSDVLGSDTKWRNLAGRQLADFVPPAELMPWLDGRKLDAVIHFGAISSTTATDADDVMETNFRLSLRLLDWCVATQTPFIYASSAATYGNGASICSTLPSSNAPRVRTNCRRNGWDLNSSTCSAPMNTTKAR